MESTLTKQIRDEKLLKLYQFYTSVMEDPTLYENKEIVLNKLSELKKEIEYLENLKNPQLHFCNECLEEYFTEKGSPYDLPEDEAICQDCGQRLDWSEWNE